MYVPCEQVLGAEAILKVEGTASFEAVRKKFKTQRFLAGTWPVVKVTLLHLSSSWQASLHLSWSTFSTALPTKTLFKSWTIPCGVPVLWPGAVTRVWASKVLIPHRLLFEFHTKNWKFYKQDLTGKPSELTFLGKSTPSMCYYYA